MAGSLTLSYLEQQLRILNQSLASQLKDTQQVISNNEDNVDTFFLIIMGMVIFFLQCGFAFLEAGSVRSKNTTNILLKNLLDSFIGCFIYWAVGYSFAYGRGNNFIGYSGFFGTFPETERISWFFQFVFAATACTIVSGSVAERCDIWPYFIYSTLITGIVYPVASRWGWYEDGWLATGISGLDNVPYLDFAGSGLVHLLGGTAAFFGAFFCGPRQGRFDMDSSNTLPGHSTPLAALGAFILLFGFFAFNGGSALAVAGQGEGVVVATCLMNTILAGTGAAGTNLSLTKIVGMIQEKCYGTQNVRSSWSLLTTINGALVGMVSICAGCNLLQSWAAFVTGILGSFFYFAVSLTLVNFQIDDPLEAVAVHAGGGLCGVLTVPFFSAVGDTERAAVIGKQFAMNLIGILSIMAWTSAWSILIFGSLKALKMLRVSASMELIGMDREKHNEPAYPIAA